MSLLKAIVLLIIAWFVFSKCEKFCGQKDQCCRCDGNEMFANEPTIKSDIQVKGVQSLSGSDLTMIAAGY